MTRGAPTNQIKMLASTVQFSTNDRPPPDPPPPDPTPPGVPATNTNTPDRQAVRGPGRPRHEDHRPHPRRPPTHTRRRPVRDGSPLPQDPTACLRPPTRTRPRSTPTPGQGGGSYWGPATAGDRTGQRSTLEHHPGHAARHP
ncbi:hypothetical protein SAMN06893096_1182 [Geodermatophilus pulveris]|uniref:Uncharacterized protein n=1 Tax=Geodermatophilus pulveris TaxID=1564159 RepID=A0A239JMW5_9ACTN|nr:hypothetical protein SAMN06893096_1182 [Geodermatophilus pulveris]